MAYDPLAEHTTRKGAASGYAPLDSGGVVPTANLPAVTTTAPGLVPDPGSVAGADRFLGGDLTYRVPYGGIVGRATGSSSGPISGTLLDTAVAGAGLYKVGLSISVVTATGIGNMTVTVSWSDAYGAQSKNFLIPLTTGTGDSQTVVVKAASGTIDYAVTIPASTSGTYNFSMAVERV